MGRIVLVFLLWPRPLAARGPLACYRCSGPLLFRQDSQDPSDEEQLLQYSTILYGKKKECTFDTLFAGLSGTWPSLEIYDTVNPFGDGDRQGQYHSVWTFDIRNDTLFYTDRHWRSQISLERLRTQDVTLSDFELLGGLFLPPVKATLDSKLPVWKPRVEIDARLRAFTHHLLRDFHYQWRHVLRNPCNATMVRVLASGIVRLATLDFKVRETTECSYEPDLRGCIETLPIWPIWASSGNDITRVGTVWVLLCQTMQDGLQMAQQHASSQNSRNTAGTDSANPPVRYMILSIKHIMLCQVTGSGSLTHTVPEPLFNGDYGAGSPSELALDYLVWATSSARPFISTRLQTLPVEIHNMILGYLCRGTVGAAKEGCLLGIGSTYKWMDGGRKVRMREGFNKDPRSLRVQSEILFGSSNRRYRSGMVYLPDREPGIMDEDTAASLKKPENSSTSE